MTFYETLSPYFDRIFPLNNEAFSLISTYFQKGDSLLDIGAGTGTMAIALAEKGLRVTAMEPEETMADTIQLKAHSKGLPITVTTKTMEQIDKLEGVFDGLICIGNTLVHLQNLEETESFLKKCFLKLNENGSLIIQIVNYDNVLANENFAFPVIKKEDFTFERHYEKSGEKILFSTTLATNENSLTNTVPLYPITSQQLESLVKKVGFQTVHVYGNFKLEQHTTDSKALILVAKKGL